MRKIFLFMMVSLDGYFEGEGHDLSWHNVDEEFNEYAIEQTKNVDTLLFGEKTYKLMEEYWPSEAARNDDPVVAEQMNTTPKIVFSKLLEKVNQTEFWKNITLLHEINKEEVEDWKREEGKDLAIYGSNNLAVGFIEMGLLDELRIMVNPVVIGAGTPLFAGIKGKLNLKLEKTQKFKNGNVLLYYSPRK